jgi:group I intron endonuclease
MGKRQKIEIKTGIYKITNKKNGKVYVGQSTNIYRRWNKHKSDAFNPKSKSYDLIIYRAIRKHGIEKFEFRIIEECQQCELNEKEIYWIAYYHTYIRDPKCHGYNQTLGGDHTLHTPNSKIRKVIADLKDTDLTFEAIAKKRKVSLGLVSEINSGKCWTQDDVQYPLRQKKETAIKIGPYKPNDCIACGKKISVGAKYCDACYRNIKAKNIPTKDILLQYVENNVPNTKIAKIFGVSDRNIKKWLDKYNIKRPRVSDGFDLEYIKLLMKERKTFKEIGEIYNTQSTTIINYLKRNGIEPIPSGAVVCVETNQTFYTIKEGAETIYPELNIGTTENKIKDSIVNCVPYQGFSWKYYYS